MRGKEKVRRRDKSKMEDEEKDSEVLGKTEKEEGKKIVKG